MSCPCAGKLAQLPLTANLVNQAINGCNPAGMSRFDVEMVCLLPSCSTLISQYISSGLAREEACATRLARAGRFAAFTSDRTSAALSAGSLAGGLSSWLNPRSSISSRAG